MFFTAFPVSEWLKTQLAGIQKLGPSGYLWFVVLYIVATVAGFPASILTLGAGAVFGILTGSVLVVIGATLGATAAFFGGQIFGAWNHRQEGRKQCTISSR
jgi:uncharacterized membrane protein YdjX (TVP38/TMEM64 family)